MAYDDDTPEPTFEELLEFADRADRARTARCPYCGAEPGQPCTRRPDGQPLRKFKAHTKRIITAETQQQEAPW